MEDFGNMTQLGKFVIVAGALLVVVGVVLVFFDRVPLIGKLPGDLHVKRGNFHFYFPLATSVLLSLVLTGLFWLIASLSRR